MRKSLLLTTIIAIVAYVVSPAAPNKPKDGKINGVIMNGSNGSVIVLYPLNRDNQFRDVNILAGKDANLPFAKGQKTFLPVVYYNVETEAPDTSIVAFIFHEANDVFIINNDNLNLGLQKPRAVPAQTDIAPPQIKPKTTGATVENRLVDRFYLPDKGVGLSPGYQSQKTINLKVGQNNEMIILENNYRLRFLEIRDYVSSKGEKNYIISQEKLSEGDSKDSVKLTLQANDLSYAVFAGNKIETVKSSRNKRNTAEYSQYLKEGINTLTAKILEGGVEKIRYYTFIASAGDGYLVPDSRSLRKPQVFYKDRKFLPIVGFDKNCFFSLLDSARGSVFEEVINANDTTASKSFFLGMNRILVKYFEETPQGRIQHSIEFFCLITEQDSVFKIDPKYFWNVEGVLVPVKLMINSGDKRFQKLEFWGMDEKGDMKKFIIRTGMVSEKIYVRTGVSRSVAYYADGLFKKSATIKMLVATQDKGKTLIINEENIDRTER